MNVFLISGDEQTSQCQFELNIEFDRMKKKLIHFTSDSFFQSTRSDKNSSTKFHEKLENLAQGSEI